MPSLDDTLRLVRETPLVSVRGRVSEVAGITLRGSGLPAFVGEVCEVEAEEGRAILAEVVGFEGDQTVLMPLAPARGIRPGASISPLGHELRVGVGRSLLGCVLDGLGRSLETGRWPEAPEAWVPIETRSPGPLDRFPITQPFRTGVAAIDALITLGRGQRMGIFAGSGVGKSVLLGQIARGAEADVRVIALVGERGREVREFLEGILGPEGMARSVVVAATSDRPPLERFKAAFVATAIAEHFRDEGLDVLFLMDSVTRTAMACREIGLAMGEPPASRGYPPSFFTTLPRLFERLGATRRGSITGLYTVLVEGDDTEEPVSDAVRSLLDGHIVLARELAQRNHYPAIDPLQSVSRTMIQVVSPEHLQAARRVREMLAVHKANEDLIRLGMYQKGNDPRLDRAIASMDAVTGLLVQAPSETLAFEDTVRRLVEVGGE